MAATTVVLLFLLKAAVTVAAASMAVVLRSYCLEGTRRVVTSDWGDYGEAGDTPR